ncbi:hypothetical protein, partial [Nocardia ninae]
MRTVTLYGTDAIAAAKTLPNGAVIRESELFSDGTREYDHNHGQVSVDTMVSALEGWARKFRTADSVHFTYTPDGEGKPSAAHESIAVVNILCDGEQYVRFFEVNNPFSRA